MGQKMRYTGSTLVIPPLSSPPFHFLSPPGILDTGRATTPCHSTVVLSTFQVALSNTHAFINDFGAPFLCRVVGSR